MIDSLGIMRLVAFIDEKLGVKVPYEDITVQNFRDLGTLSHYVDRRKHG
jgi:acyl carrier protein